jgi:hypothetical protein
MEIDNDGFVKVEGDFWVYEKCVCDHCVDQRLAAGKLLAENEERYSFGHYAGRYCHECWAKSGFRDATNPCAKFSADDAGESLNGEDDAGIN